MISTKTTANEATKNIDLGETRPTTGERKTEISQDVEMRSQTGRKNKKRTPGS